VIPDPAALVHHIVLAAQMTHTRVVLQSSWTKMGQREPLPNLVFPLGDCPHDWLFPRMSAVIHHGRLGLMRRAYS
jgi:sterol 3beta-glucosyltransferase